jgi:hypothetical protein
LPGAFNGFFIHFAWGFHCKSHMHCLALSMDFSFILAWGFHYESHIHSLALSMDFSFI